MFLFASLIIFSASVLIGGIGPALSGSFNQFMTNFVINYLSVPISTGKGTTLSIFMNNSNFAFLYMYLGGIPFGTISIGELASLGLINGFLFAKYHFIIFYSLPHGIFELSSYVITVAAGFKLLSIIINILKDILHLKWDVPVGEQINVLIEDYFLEFKDSVTLFMIAMVLLVIAAFIEANVSLAFGNYITGLNIHNFAEYLLNLINH